jgi:hypothetical protein
VVTVEAPTAPAGVIFTLTSGSVRERCDDIPKRAKFQRAKPTLAPSDDGRPVHEPLAGDHEQVRVGIPGGTAGPAAVRADEEKGDVPFRT